MEITVLGSGGGESPELSPAGFRIGRNVLVDAGTIGARMPLAEQRELRHVLLTHAHLDHVHALPFLLDNLIGRIPDSLNLYSRPEILAAVHEHIFNGKIWPDFSRLPTPEAPVLCFCPIESGRPFAVGDYLVEAIPMIHSFSSVAYLVSNGRGSAVFTGDTAPSDALWQRLRGVSDLKAIFIEASFPSGLQQMASRTNHLTPSDVEGELKKLGDAVPVPVYLYHVKPEYDEEISREAAASQSWPMRVVKAGETIQAG